MKKVMVILAAMMFIMAGSLFAAPITMKNTLTFGDKGFASNSGDPRITATLDKYSVKDKHVHHLRHEDDYVQWSYKLNFDPKKDASDAVIDLKIKLHSDDHGLPWIGEASAKVGVKGFVWDDDSFDDVKEFKYRLTLNGDTLSVIVINNGHTDWGADGFYLDEATLNVSYNPAPVPEPATMTLLGIGMLGAGMAARKRNRKQNSAE